jgi:hypothetical protein
MVDLVGLDPTPGPTVVCLRLSRHLRLYPEGADNLDDRPRSPLDHSLGDLGLSLIVTNHFGAAWWTFQRIDQDITAAILLHRRDRG